MPDLNFDNPDVRKEMFSAGQNWLAVRLAIVASIGCGVVVRTGADKQTIPTADIIRMTSGAHSPPGVVPDAAGQRDGDPWTLTLTWGDVLPGRVIGAHGESVVIDNADLGEVAIPIEAVARI